MTIWTHRNYSQCVTPFVEMAAGITLRSVTYGILDCRTAFEVQCGELRLVLGTGHTSLPHQPARHD